MSLRRRRRAPSGVRLDSRGTLAEKLAWGAATFGDQMAEEAVDEEIERTGARVTPEQRAELIRAGREALRREWGA